MRKRKRPKPNNSNNKKPRVETPVRLTMEGPCPGAPARPSRHPVYHGIFSRTLSARRALHHEELQLSAAHDLGAPVTAPPSDITASG